MQRSLRWSRTKVLVEGIAEVRVVMLEYATNTFRLKEVEGVD
jgi:hypothetical protein